METVKILCVSDYGQVVLFDTEASSYMSHT